MTKNSSYQLFIIYSRKDQGVLKELLGHLRPLEKRGDLAIWYDDKISPGQNWEAAIKDQLNNSNIIILIISKDFLNSDYIEKEEFKIALERHWKGQAIIVPVIARPCLWEANPNIKTFQVLPKGAKPVSSWNDRDEAWLNVAQGVLGIIDQRKETLQKNIETDSQNLSELLMNNLNVPSESFADLCNQVYKQVQESDDLTGIPSGFSDIDRITAGWHRSDLIIIAARPGMGMDWFILSMVLNITLRFNTRVAYFSLQLNKGDIVQRLISMDSGIPPIKMRKKQLEDYEWQHLDETVNRLKKASIYIDDISPINIFELRTKCQRLKIQSDIQLIIIDNLQHITLGGRDIRNFNSEPETPNITQGLKNMAKELNVPVIVLSELSKMVEVRGGSKRPTVSDLEGHIEVDADIIAFIYRPEYYYILEDETGNSLKGQADFIIAKHRRGAIDTIKLKFIEQLSKFVDLNDIEAFKLDHINTPINRPSRMNEEDIPF